MMQKHLPPSYHWWIPNTLTPESLNIITLYPYNSDTGGDSAWSELSVWWKLGVPESPERCSLGAQNNPRPWLAAEISICVESCVRFYFSQIHEKLAPTITNQWFSDCRKISSPGIQLSVTPSHCLGWFHSGFLLQKTINVLNTQKWGVLTDPFSITLFNMTTPRLFCSQTISQKWPQVFGKGPCRDTIPRNKHHFL